MAFSEKNKIMRKTCFLYKHFLLFLCTLNHSFNTFNKKTNNNNNNKKQTTRISFRNSFPNLDTCLKYKSEDSLGRKGRKKKESK